ncbi:hypothetical protein ACF3OH_10495 [Chryseomicrobium aureum]|uniref:hypothetical protein n=1 Tax=Chryseomicrobium aureum TaxID=1441723 RepID=UPI00370D633A
MKRKLILSFLVVGCLLSGPAAAKLSTGNHFQEWHNKQLQLSKTITQQEVISQTVVQMFDFANWIEEMAQLIDEQLDVSELVSSRSIEMNEYADMQQGRVQATKSTVHTNELEVFAEEQKEELPTVMEEELAKYFESEFLNRE